MYVTKSLSLFCCMMLTFHHFASSYPLVDDLQIAIPNDDVVPRQTAIDKRRMGWRICTASFRWRCGKERLVMRGRRK